jgi:hypothetical protein
MNFILALLAAAKSIGMAAGIVTAGKSDVIIVQPRIIIAPREIRLSCVLSNAWPADLKKLARTGTDIILYLIIETRRNPGNTVVGRVTVERRLQYDAVARSYIVISNPPADTADFGALDSALIASVTFDNVPAMPKASLDAGAEYSFVIYGVLGTTKVEALDNSGIDLMYFWNYRRPMAETERFRGSVLKEGKAASR